MRLAATEFNNVVTYTVIIEAQNDDRRLFPGMTANVHDRGRPSATKRLRVPNDALRFKPRGEVERERGAARARGGQIAASGRSERLKNGAAS